MIVAFFDARIDAPHVDLRSDRRILRMFAIDLDPAAEARELAESRAKELMHTKPDRGARRIELVALAADAVAPRPPITNTAIILPTNHFIMSF